jgi:hypothetical protein
MNIRNWAAAAALMPAALLCGQEVIKDIQTIGIAPQAATFQFIAAEPGMLGKTVTGAPYSGEGFTETVRTLADGGRIVNKHSKKVWRDSQGRTREESTLPIIGPWSAAGEAPKIVTISDPVAKVIITLNEREKTAFRHKMPDISELTAKIASAGGTATATSSASASGSSSSPPEGKTMVWRTTEEREITVSGGAAGAAVAGHKVDLMMADGGPAGPGMLATVGGHMMRLGGKEEPLAPQTMEGLKVEGKRITNTIKTGEIGNDRELVTITERWTSPELQVLIRMTAKDPQSGETTYRLTNISRGEPSVQLFQVPADYRVTEGTGRIMMRRRSPESKQ